MKLEAKSRLLRKEITASPLDGNAKVSQEAEGFLALIQSELKRKGFKRTRASKQSAMFEWQFTREQDGRVIRLNGWHGTGGWGKTKAVFSLYDNKPNPGTKTGDYGLVAEGKTSMTPEQHTDLIKHLTAYVKAIK